MCTKPLLSRNALAGASGICMASHEWADFRKTTSGSPTIRMTGVATWSACV